MVNRGDAQGLGLRRKSAMFLLALWWGGFTFYAARVVFIGHEVLGNKTTQGFITERVTTNLNYLACAALAAAGWELSAAGRSRRRTQAFTALGITVVATGFLFALHSLLARELDFEARRVLQPERFYQLHRVYLLVATVQWAAGATLFALLDGSTKVEVKR